MDRNQFNQWFRRHYTLFPSVLDWFAELDKKGEVVPDDVKEAWFSTMADVELRDALAVSEGIAKGMFPEIENYRIEKTPSIVRTDANILKDKREGNGPDKFDHSHKRGQYTPLPIAPVLKAIREMVKQGSSLEEAIAHGKSMLANDPCQDNPRNAYRCISCRDCGWRFVWSKKTMQNAIAGMLDRVSDRTTAAVPCTCKKGQRHQANYERQHGNGKDVSYSPFKHIETTGPSDKKALAELEEWAEEERRLLDEKFAPTEAKLF